MGNIDELACYLGVCCLYVPDDGAKQLHRAQNALSEILGCIACGFPASSTITEFAAELELWTNTSNEKENPTAKFSSPQGDPEPWFLGIAQSVCRRAKESSRAVKCDATIRSLVGPVFQGLAGYLSMLAAQQAGQGKAGSGLARAG
jgi:cob(I)alamin adenosyltransferase